MDLLNSRKTKARKTYETYWESYSKGDLETFASTLDDHYEMIGTSETEVCHSKADGIAFLKAQMHEVVGKVEMRNRQIDVQPVENLMLINEQCDVYVLTDSDSPADTQNWNFYSKIRLSTILRETESGWKVTQQHGSFPDMRVQEGETLALEKINKENLELRDAVKRRTAELENKNRELAIEAALEKVRAVAMGMKKPEDMLDVCREISDRLQDFGVTKIRNVQTAIIDETIGQYLCYQYFTPYEKTAVEKTEYLKSPVEHSMVRQMLASRDGYFIGRLSGIELEDFRIHRKEENHFPDPFLDNSTELDYCFLSIGEGGLGLTLYQPMAEDILTLFKRFHQVFSLAYQRFRDIQKAEAHARESEIDLALERVRAQTMAMHSSEDVGKCVVKMFSELTALGVDEGTRFGIGILNHHNENNQLWTARKNGEEVNMHIGNIDMTLHPLLKSVRKAWKAQVPLRQYVLEGEDLLDYYQMLNNAPDYRIQIPIEKLPKKEIQHCFIFEHGFFYAFTPREFQPELIHITKRFSSLFEQTYRRYLDLVRAEAQAREAEIELALERVRARTMAMHHTEELKEVIQVVFDQFVGLKIHVDHAGFILDYKEREDMHIWLADHQQGVPTEISIPYFDSPHWNSYREAKAKQESFFANLLPFELKNKFYQDLFELIPELTEEAQQAIFSKPALAISTVLLDNVGLYIEHYSGTPFTAEENAILMRFGKVFQQTYTRFLDLVRAEAQAREAQIEAALEKVRSRSLAMHKSSELNEVVKVLFEKTTDLQVPSTAVGIQTFIEGSKDMMVFVCGDVGTGIVVNQYVLPYFDHPIVHDYLNAHKKKLESFVGRYSKKEKDSFYDVVLKLPELIELPAEVKTMICNSDFYEVTIVPAERSLIAVNDFQGNPLSESQVGILKRFAKVFDQTYTRFLDLQKAEAQTREAQIEAALERVRSRSLAMHKTSELQSVIHTVHHELLNLNISISGGSFIVINSEIDNEIHCWGSGGTADTSDEVHIPRFDKPFYTHLLEGIKNGPGFFTEEYSQNEKIEFFTFLFHHEPWSKLSAKEKKNTLSAPGGYTRSCAVAKHTSIFIINHFGERFSEAENAILIRFGKVFEQSYTRFLDLQKAEAQAREAQIQLSLERIRAKAMAMQHSDELSEFLTVVFEQFDVLNLNPVNCHLSFFDLDNNRSIFRLTGKNGATLIATQEIDLDASPLWKQKIENWKLGNPSDVDVLFTPYDRLPEIAEIFQEIISKIPDDDRPLPEDWPDGQYVVEGNCKYGYLGYAGSRPPSEEEKEITRRIANEFGNVYQRFLDLEKAEAQAREAQIQLSLERIRAKAMSMQHSNELSDFLTVLFEQFAVLNLSPVNCHLAFFDIEKNRSTFRLTGKKGAKLIATQEIDWDASPLWKKRAEDWKAGNFNDVEVSFNPLENLPEIGEIFKEILSKLPEDDRPLPEDYPNGQYVVEGYCKYGYLGYSASVQPSDEQKEITRRIANEFGNVYQRFLDLQKAEAQAREAQIENALEKVRSRTMAMQRSDELTDVAGLLFNQVSALGIKTWTAGFNVWSEDNNSYVDYLSLNGEIYGPNTVHTEKAEALMDLSNARKSGVEFDVLYVEGEKIKQLYLAISGIDEKEYDIMVKDGLLPSQQYEHFVFGAKVSVMFITYEPVPEAHEIFKRLGKVFEQTYTRFLDLQKAEAQAREAKIETSLEKVRSRTMGMQSSEELPEVANLLFTEVRALGIHAWSCGYNILAADKKTATCCMSSEGTLQTPFQLRLWGENSFDEMGEFVLSDHAMLVQELGDKALEEHYAYMKSFPDLKPTFDEIDRLGLSLPTYQINHLCKFNGGFILFITYEKVPESHPIFKRFTNVFDQTYTRFLDLLKAEAQAKEARIEAALERVRSRTMGMQKAEELGEVATVLFGEMNTLVDNLWTCGFVLCEKDRREDEWWLSLTNGLIEPFSLPNVGDYAHEMLYEGWEKGEAYRTVTLENERLQKHYDWLTSIPIARQIFEDMESSGIPRPNWQRLHAAYFKTGYLVIITEMPCEEEEIFKRFAQVFDLTYTRFLDLQKAEAQARESEIQLALERVRARTMAMHKSDELSQTAAVLFEQLQVLGNTPERINLGIFKEESGTIEWWITTQEGHQIRNNFFTKFEDHFVFPSMLNAWKAKEKSTVITLSGVAVTDWIRYITQQIGMPVNPGLIKEKRIISCAFFSQGLIGTTTSEPLSPGIIHLLERFASVFEQAYTRFLDLQKAEAQAREATKQASLDRVRGVIASMRSATDLELITPLIFKELTILGVPFIRCGVFIIDEKQELVNAYLSSPEGNSLGVLKLPYHASELTQGTVEAWRKGEVYRQHWNKEDFVQWINIMMQQDQIQDSRTYQGASVPPESLDLHFVPFTQGMLYVGAISPLDERELELVKSLAKAFSIAYARYEDFDKLDRAKSTIEAALSELKSTQSQLVQQEKLASLGQLTAGIAHEIKNPLNFVNNFSEVSIEMIGETLEEFEKREARDETLIKDNLEDIKSNLQKVHEHGTRANSIVTSMLQHSRGGSGKIEPTDLNALIKEYVNLSFHGMRAGKNPIDVEIALELDEAITEVPLIKEDFTRVIINLCNNAFDAMRGKKYQVSGIKHQDVEENDIEYLPKLNVTTSLEKGQIRIAIQDNGPGIPDEIKDKILQPFFTTKKGTEGTGLGLSITHDIIKAHGGSLSIESDANGSVFTITIPTNS